MGTDKFRMFTVKDTEDMGMGVTRKQCNLPITAYELTESFRIKRIWLDKTKRKSEETKGYFVQYENEESLRIVIPIRQFYRKDLSQPLDGIIIMGEDRVCVSNPKKLAYVEYIICKWDYYTEDKDMGRNLKSQLSRILPINNAEYSDENGNMKCVFAVNGNEKTYNALTTALTPAFSLRNMGLHIDDAPKNGKDIIITIEPLLIVDGAITQYRVTHIKSNERH